MVTLQKLLVNTKFLVLTDKILKVNTEAQVLTLIKLTVNTTNLLFTFFMKETKPYLPVANFQQILDFIPGQPQTYTASPIVNAVAEALYETKCIESKELAAYLVVDSKKLAHAVQLDLGMTLIDVIQTFRIHQIEEYHRANPEATLDEVAQACGYSSKGSVWRFFQRKLGKTVMGKKSQAGPELWLKMREDSKKRRRFY